jgi:transcriptional regulator with XRE-family HTH domain
MSFRENLKRELTYSGLLVKELALQTGIHKRTIDKYLTEKGSSPSVENAVLIARVLGVSVEYLVTGRGGIPRDQHRRILCPEARRIANLVDHLDETTRKTLLTMIQALPKSP